MLSNILSIYISFLLKGRKIDMITNPSRVTYTLNHSITCKGSMKGIYNIIYIL